MTSKALRPPTTRSELTFRTKIEICLVSGLLIESDVLPNWLTEFERQFSQRIYSLASVIDFRIDGFCYSNWIRLNECVYIWWFMLVADSATLRHSFVCDLFLLLLSCYYLQHFFLSLCLSFSSLFALLNFRSEDRLAVLFFVLVAFGFCVHSFVWPTFLLIRKFNFSYEISIIISINLCGNIFINIQIHLLATEHHIFSPVDTLKSRRVELAFTIFWRKQICDCFEHSKISFCDFS